MSQVSLEHAHNMELWKKHKNLLKMCETPKQERKAIDKIKVEIPQGKHLKEYLEELRTEITQEAQATAPAVATPETTSAKTKTSGDHLC